jgi:hypothetical protein
MSTAIGITGDVVLPSGFNLAVRRGSLNISITPVDITNTGSAGWNEMLGGVKGCSGSAVGYPKYGSSSSTAPGLATLPSGSTVYVPAAMTYKVVGATTTYTFSAIITSIAHGFDYKGEANVTFSFVSSGAVTETAG